jgi:hypothetical protein
MRDGGFVVALLLGVVVAKFAENEGAHRGTFCGRIGLPIEAETLTADATLNILPEFGSSE